MNGTSAGCVGKWDGDFPYTEDCHKYVSCTGGLDNYGVDAVAYIRDCPAGLYFQPYQLKCLTEAEFCCDGTPTVPKLYR